MSRTHPWIIVGGGASGLAAAFFLKQLGLDSEIIERESAIGGRMGTVTLGDRPLDCGGKNIGKRYRLFRQFAVSLGDYPLEYFGLNSSQVIDGRIRTFEAGARWRTLLDVARGVPTRDLVRFARLLWRVKSDEATGYLGSAYSRTLGGRYDHQPANRYFSPAFCQRIIRPMSVRMNGAEPDEVYLGNLPANVRMLLDTYEQFAEGLGPLLRSFASRYRVRLNTSVDGLLVSGRRATGVTVRYPDGSTDDVAAAGVILATPASGAARVTESILPGLADQLRSIAYYPVALVIAEYDRPIFLSATRAFVFDGNQPVSNAGAYGVNDLHIVRYTFSGRTSRDHLSDSMDPEALLRLGEAALATCVPVNASWRRRFVARRFDPGLCAYAPYHSRFIDGMNEQLKTMAGLYLTGDYIQGASIEACFRSASRCVQRLAGTETTAVHQSASPRAAAYLH